MITAKQPGRMQTVKTFGTWLFWAAIILSEIAGAAIIRWPKVRELASAPLFHGHSFLSMLLIQIVGAALVFFLLYRLVALKIVRFTEDWHGIKIRKPGVAVGMFFTAVIPLVLCAIGFLIISFLSGTPVSS
jgi:hypothetical protein